MTQSMNALAAHREAESSGRLTIADGTLEAIKWLALALMTGDHINKYLYAEKLPYLFQAGRIAMPLFVFVLAYNLTRPGSEHARLRTAKRLALWGGLASPAYMLMGANWWPLNIMFMLGLCCVLLVLHEKAKDNKAAVLFALLFVVGGAVVEFWWPAILMFFAARAYFLQQTKTRLALLVLATTSLALINQNFWAVAAIPVFLAAQRIDLDVGRNKWVFYAYYPAHLTVLFAITRLQFN